VDASMQAFWAWTKVRPPSQTQSMLPSVKVEFAPAGQSKQFPAASVRPFRDHAPSGQRRLLLALTHASRPGTKARPASQMQKSEPDRGIVEPAGQGMHPAPAPLLSTPSGLNVFGGHAALPGASTQALRACKNTNPVASQAQPTLAEVRLEDEPAGQFSQRSDALVKPVALQVFSGHSYAPPPATHSLRPAL